MSASYLFALGLTLACELPLVVWWAGQGKRRRALVDGALLNLWTHPLATLLFRAWSPGRYGAGFWLIELGVVAAEAGGYRWATGLSGRRALVVSLGANGVTALLSLALASGTGAEG